MQIIEKKQRGDTQMVADMLEISYHNAAKALTRKNSKYHQRAKAALTKIIEDRERTKEQGKVLFAEEA